jgi:prefoldin subunit 5
MEGINKLTESSKTMNELIQELNDKFTQLAEEAEQRMRASHKINPGKIP